MHCPQSLDRSSHEQDVNNQLTETKDKEKCFSEVNGYCNGSSSGKHVLENVNLGQPPLAQLTDRFGNTFQFGNAGDYWHPPFPIGVNTDYRTHLSNIRNMEIRPDDIFLCSYPKTGHHWTYEIVTLLRNKRVDHVEDETFLSGFLDMSSMAIINAAPSPRILVTHVPFRHLPKQMFEKKIKIILLDRNPKDVLVSYYNHWRMRKPPFHYPGSFEQFIHLYFEVGYIYGHFFDYMMEWQNGIETNPQLDVFVNVFEEMKIDPVGGVHKLNTFLGTGCSDELCENIAKACAFHNMKEFKDQTRPQYLNSILVSKKVSIYRKGDVGDWENWFTDEMNEKFDNEFNKWIKKYKTKYIFTLP